MSAPSTPDARGYLSTIIEKGQTLGLIDVKSLASSISPASLMTALEQDSETRAIVLEKTTGMKASIIKKAGISVQIATDYLVAALELKEASPAELVELVGTEKCLSCCDILTLWNSFSEQKFWENPDQEAVKAWLVYVIEYGLELKVIYEYHIAKGLGLRKILTSKTVEEMDSGAIAEVFIQLLEKPEARLGYKKVFELFPPKLLVNSFTPAEVWEVLAGLTRSALGLSPPTEQPPAEDMETRPAESLVNEAVSIAKTGEDGREAPPADDAPSIEVVKDHTSVRRGEGSQSGEGSSVSRMLQKQALEPRMKACGLSIPDKYMDLFSVDDLRRLIQIVETCSFGPDDEQLNRISVAFCKAWDFTIPQDRIDGAKPGSLKTFLPIGLKRCNKEHAGIQTVAIVLVEKIRAETAVPAPESAKV